MICKNCGYEWTYSGDMIYATCPSCKHGNKRK